VNAEDLRHNFDTRFWSSARVATTSRRSSKDTTTADTSHTNVGANKRLVFISHGAVFAHTTTLATS